MNITNDPSKIDISNFTNKNSKWVTLKEFIQSTMNSNKVTLESSCHYQTILNKMYELEEK